MLVLFISPSLFSCFALIFWKKNPRHCYLYIHHYAFAKLRAIFIDNDNTITVPDNQTDSHFFKTTLLSGVKGPSVPLSPSAPPPPGGKHFSGICSCVSTELKLQLDVYWALTMCPFR